MAGEDRDRFAEARRRIEREDYAGALRGLQEIRAEGAEAVEVLRDMALCHIGLGEPARALECYDAAVALDGSDPDLWSDRALALLELGRHSDALESARRALEINRSHYAAACGSARALLELGDAERALEMAERAVALSPLEEGGLFLAAEAARRTGRREDAAQHYRRVLKVNPHNTQAAYRLEQLEQYRRMEKVRRWERVWERWSGLERLPFVMGFLIPGAILVALGSLVPTIKGGNILLFRAISISVGAVLILISLAVMVSGRFSGEKRRG